MRYVVQKTIGVDTAWLSVPAGNSANAVFVSDRAQATEFRFRATAALWVWDLGGEVITVDETV